VGGSLGTFLSGSSSLKCALGGFAAILGKGAPDIALLKFGSSRRNVSLIAQA
jgi:hypothetical protein